MGAIFPQPELCTMAASPYETDDARWAAVQTRDPNADTVFVYGVITT
ncbi:MAG: Ada metal-binding domain-containing protein, partial [Rhodospirillaceae bacterium]